MTNKQRKRSYRWDARNNVCSDSTHNGCQIAVETKTSENLVHQNLPFHLNCVFAAHCKPVNIKPEKI